jgi:hypothetical protein
LGAENFLNTQDTDIFSRRTLLGVVDLSVIRYYNMHLKYSIPDFPSVFARRPFWFRKITTDPHIPAHVNIDCLDGRYPKIIIYVSEMH